MKRLLLIFLVIFQCTPSNAQETTPLHFALLTQRQANDAFWSLNEDFAQAVAKQLGFKLTVFHGQSSKKKMFNSLKKASDLGVNGFIFANYDGIGAQLIDQAETLKLPVLLFNADLSTEHIKLSGYPQQHYKYWLARLMPDDYQAGYLLAKSLIQQAKHKGLSNDKGIIEVVAINGIIDNGPSMQRLAGLKAAIKEEQSSKLQQVVYAQWLQNKAHYQTEHLNQRYPNAKVFWAASDLMAIGAYQALSKQGLQQGVDYVTGGIDWTTQGLEALLQGKISTSVGGHFMDAGWATIILYDYFKGFAFTDSHLNQYQSKVMVLTQKDVSGLLQQLNNKNWQHINFLQYSKFHNKKLSRYPLNPRLILPINTSNIQ